MMDSVTIQMILDSGGAIEVGGSRFFKTDSGKYVAAFWNHARCGFWKTYFEGDIDEVTKEIAALSGMDADEKQS